MTEYAWGVLTPFIAVGVLAVLVGAGYVLVAVARHLWAKTHVALLQKVELRRNLVNPFDEDDRPEYLEAANKFRDALIASPRLRIWSGFGWMLVAVRDGKREDV